MFFISFLLILSFPDILTQKNLCELEARKIRAGEIRSAEESVNSFLILMCAGRKSDAEKLLKDADDKFPENFAIKFNLGNFYITEGKLDFAIFYLNQARRINQVPQVFESLSTAYLYRGDIKSARSILDEGIKELSKSEPKNILPLLKKKGYISLLLNDPEEAEKSFRRSIEIDPTDPYLYVGLAESFGRQNKDRSAIEVLSKVQTLTNNPILQLYSAVFLHSRGYLDMATVYYINAAESLISPLGYLSKLLLSSAQRDLGMYTDARENFEEVVKKYPDVKTAKVPFFPEYRLELALGFLQKGNIKGAETEIREILKNAPDNPEAQKVLVELLLMKALLFSEKANKIKNLEEAREIAKKYIDKNPSDDEMLYRFALINFWLAEIGPKFARSGNIMHAISSLQSALKLKDRREYTELLGICYYLIEKYDDAIQELQKVADQKYTLGLILSSAYLKSGNPDMAKKVLQRLGARQDRIFALLLYNISKAQKAENIETIEQAIMEENYTKLILDEKDTRQEPQDTKKGQQKDQRKVKEKKEEPKKDKKEKK